MEIQRSGKKFCMKAPTFPSLIWYQIFIIEGIEVKIFKSIRAEKNRACSCYDGTF
jgi:hypothetical protein